MKKNKIIWIITVIVIVSILIAYFNFKNTTLDKKQLKIGVILPLTGDAASYGKSLQEGIIIADSLASDSIGYQLKIIYEDSKAEPLQAINSINKLISVDKVDCIIGDMFTSTTLAISPIAEKNDLLLISPTGSASEISKDKRCVFRIYPSEIEEGNTLSKFYIEKFNSQKSAIIFANEDAMKNVVNTIKTNLGDSIVLYESSFNKGIIDFKNIITSIPKNISNVFIIGYLNDAALFVKQSKELNRSFNFLGISTLYDKLFIDLTKNASEDIFLTAPFFSTKSENNKVKQFVSKYISMYKKEPDVWAGYGFDVLNIAAKVLMESKIKNIKPFEAMEKLRNYDGVTGMTSINPDHTIDKQFNIVQISNKYFQVIK